MVLLLRRCEKDSCADNRYIDPTGTVQGPFSATDMSDWYKAGYLKDLDLPVIGHVSPHISFTYTSTETRLKQD